MLYALGIGFGRDPARAGELAFVFEGGGLRVAPTFASAIARSGFLEGLRLGREPPGAGLGAAARCCARCRRRGTLLLDSEVTAVHDLGRDDGALVLVEFTARHAADQQVLFAVERGILARGDGGFGACRGHHRRAARRCRRAARTCTATCEIRAEQGLVYRLERRHEPDPCRSRAGAPRRLAGAGPPEPVHPGGGLPRRAGDDLRFRSDADHGLRGRYTGGVYPGDRLRLDLWQDANIVSFRVSVPARSGS